MPQLRLHPAAMRDALGLYISVPFCRAKCTFCNFASDAFAPAMLPRYLDAVCREIRSVQTRVAALGAGVGRGVDSIYLGGGTPSLLSPLQIRELFGVVRAAFDVAADAEITVECAPGQLSEASLAEFARQGVNRLSFGVQSFVDVETRRVGRTHTGAECLRDVERARAAGVRDVSLDLIAGLPGQTAETWRRSIAGVLDAEVNHASVYMLEVDEDSRLGREVLAAGTHYGAPEVPSDDECVDFYEHACDEFERGGLLQYEISNFAREGACSRHNLKYWRRAPYLGFGLDAHSMLPVDELRAVRFANGDDLERYVAAQESGVGASGRGTATMRVLSSSDGGASPVDLIGPAEALEESLFLGLRTNAGVEMGMLRARFGAAVLLPIEAAIAGAIDDGLLESVGAKGAQRRTVRLTRRGRALANEVFARLLVRSAAAA